jgi:predicted DNA-binding WGR domain protein
MKLIRKARLYFKEGKSDKVYEVDLCRLSKGRYVVNFRYGRRGSRLREGTKTLSPVERQKAEDIFNSVVVSKKNKGYKDSDEQPQLAVKFQAPPAADPSDVTDRRELIETAVLKRFQDPSIRADLKKLRRVVWRIGELAIKQAVPDLMALIPSKDELMNYCVAWTLGRCADTRAFPALNRLFSDTGSDMVKRTAREALLATATEDQARDIIDGIVQQLSQPVKKALASDDSSQLAAAAGSTIFQGGPQGMGLLEDLYRVAVVIPCARAFILSTLNEIPFKPDYFKAIRHIYKTAEFRLDADVIGLLALRFETEKACYFLDSGSRYATLPGTWEYVKIKDEVTKPDSRLAYSSRTRDYFRRRGWRILRRLGNSDDEQYVKMAVGILLPFTDQHAAAPKKSTRYRWEQGAGGRWHSVPEAVREYGPYGGYVAFNHILHSHHAKYRLSPNGLTWLTVSEPDAETPAGLSSAAETRPEPRHEAFPQLWDRQPEALWQLLSESRCEPVHRFATRALMDNADFCRQLTSEQIRVLLSRPYEATIVFGLSLARHRYDPSNPDFDLIEALLTADLEPARRTARQWIEDQPDMLVQAPGLMTFILTCGHADVRQWGHTLIERAAFDDAHIEGLIARLVAFLLGLDDRADAHSVVIEDIGTVMLGVWAPQCRRIDIRIIEDLLQHPLTALQVLAGQLLLQHHTPPEKLPPALIRSLIEAHSPELRGIGVQLFSGLPEPMLLRQADLIYTFCISGDQQVRQAAHPMVRRLAQSDNAFAHDLFERLFPLIFQKAPSPEFRQDFVALLSDGLEKPALTLDSNTVWRLLQARALSARQLGAHLLARANPQAFSIRQWALLGSHALLAVRQWSWDVYTDHSAHIAGNMADGLRLLDSNWDDTRDFAIDYFRNNFDAAHWTPVHLVSICDSTREDVQRFGRELITTFFENAHGAEYLLKLSQHPSTNVQLFASNFLEDYTRGDLQRIGQLTPYFVTVMSQVNCGRVAKARIFKFLHHLARESAEAAALVAPICNRISATIAIGDRGSCVRILRDINRKYPQVSTRLETIPVPRRPINTVEVDHAV